MEWPLQGTVWLASWSPRVSGDDETLGFRSVARSVEIHGVTADDGRSELVLFEASLQR